MSGALGSLVVKLALEYAQYTQGLDKSEQAALAAAKKVQDTFDDLKKKVASTAGSIAGGIAAGFTINAFKSLIAGTVEAGEKLHDLSLQSGASVEALSGLIAIGKYTGVAGEDIAAAMNKLAKNLASVDDEGKGAGKALSLIGLDLDTFRSLKPEEQFQVLAKALDGYADGSGKAVVAQALLGKEGAKLLPFLKDLGVVGDLQAKITTEQADRADNLSDNWLRLTTSGDAWKKELAQGIIPALDIGAQAMLDVTNGSGGLREEVKKLVADGSVTEWANNAVTGATYLLDAVTYVKRALIALGDALGGYVAAKVEQFTGAAKAVMLFINGNAFGAFDALNESARKQDAIYAALGETLSDTFGEPTLGQRLRARIVDLQKVGTAGKETKKSLDGVSLAGGKDGKGVDEAQKAYEALNKRIVERLALSESELKAGRELTDYEKFYAKTVAELTAAKSKLTAAQKQAIVARLEEAQSAETAVAVQRSEIKLAKELSDARQAQARSDEQAAAAFLRQLEDERHAALKSVEDRVQALDDEAEAARVAAERHIPLAVAIEQVAIARLREKQAGFFEGSEGYAAIEREIEARQRLLSKIGDKALRDEAQQLADDVNRSLTDSLYRAWESGGKFFKTFWDGVKNTLKTQLIKVPIQFVTGAITNIASSALGLSGTAQAASGGNSLSMLSGLGSLASGTGILGAAGLGLQAGFGALIEGGFAGIAAAVEGGLAAIGAGTAGSLAAGLGTIAGALGPIALGAYAVYSLFDSGGGPKTESGYGPGVDVRGDPTSSRAISDSIEASYQQLAATLGLAIKDLQVGVFTAIDSAGDALTQLEVSAQQDGVEIYNRQARYGANSLGSGIENVGRSQEELQAAINEEASQVLLAALRASDLPQKFKDYLDHATDINSAVSTVAAVAQLDKALRALGGPLANLADMSVDAEIAFVNQMGGLQGLSTAISGYLENYYSEGERQELLTRQLTGAFADLGMALPGTRAELRGLIETASNSGNAELAGKLLQLQGAFATLVPAAADLTGQIEDMAEGMRTAADIANERKQLEDQLLQLQGNAAELRLRERSAIDASNLALFDQITALQAAQAAQQQAADIAQQRAQIEQQILQANGDTAAIRAAELAALDPANRAIKESYYARLDELDALQATQRQAADIAQQRAQIEQQILQASGDTAAIRAAELAALDPANRAIKESYYARLDELDAIQAGQRAIAEAQQRAGQVLSERLGLEQQLLQLQGDTAELRRRELAALDPSNQALQISIYTLKDEADARNAAAQATADAARAEQALMQERQGLEQQLLELQGNTEELRRRQLAALDPSNQALQQEIWALQDAKSAATASASAIQQVSTGMTDMAKAAEQLFDSVGSAIAKLRGDMLGQQLSGEEARAQVAAAVAMARAGGPLPTAEALQGALSASTQFDATAYATQADLADARARTLANLVELQSLTGVVPVTSTVVPSVSVAMPSVQVAGAYQPAVVSSGGGADVQAQLQLVAQGFARVTAQLDAIARSAATTADKTTDAADALDQLSTIGIAINNPTSTPVQVKVVP